MAKELEAVIKPYRGGWATRAAGSVADEVRVMNVVIPYPPRPTSEAQREAELPSPIVVRRQGRR